MNESYFLPANTSSKFQILSNILESPYIYLFIKAGYRLLYIIVNGDNRPRQRDEMTDGWLVRGCRQKKVV